MQEEIMDKANIAALNATDGLSRRRFLTYAGALAGAGMLMASCNNDDDDKQVIPAENVLDLGSSDIGGANMLYITDQISAAFFTKVMASPFIGMDSDTQLFDDMRAHCIAHRELMKSLLGNQAKPELEVKLEGINFTNKGEVLEHASRITDISVMAYNRVIGRTISQEWKGVTTKMASVKCRHNAYIHEMIAPGSFADTANENGMDQQLPSQTILDYASGYLYTKLSSASFGY
ncbi:MAG: hypothetical protein EOP56_15560 [Sphingobacteriales bacterium]|nr:MAG: hypothetical protein EOP56_15560 [Sphingobacteriales bacterium]